MSMHEFLEQPWSTQWRKALLSLPRAVPDFVLRYTSPEGPHPVIVKIPSRAGHLLPLYVFIPPAAHVSEPGSEAPRRKWPVLVDFHGGGFIFGSCQEQAPFCAMFAREAGCVVLSVDYRLGPTSKFPAALEDAEDVLNAVLNSKEPGFYNLRDAISHHIPKHARPLQLDHERVGLSGFSSGGNLALNLVVSIKAGGECPEPWPSVIPPNFSNRIPVLLYYPSLDCRQLPSERPRPPGMEPKGGFLARLRIEDELMPTYLPRDQAAHPRASPGLADIAELHPQARMLLVLPELDTLGAQSEVWVKKVEEGGRAHDLEVERVKGVLHGWTQFPDSWLSEEHRRLKAETFRNAKRFVKDAWGVA